MAHVRVTQQIPATAAAVWGRIGDPAALSAWHPAIVDSPVHGDERRCTLGDGAVIVERIVGRDEAGMQYRYRIVESPLPLRGYEATLRVEAAGDGCRVTWESEFETDADPAEITALLRGVYDAGLQALAATA